MGHTPKTNELCPHGLDPNICGYCWNKAIANMIDENTNLKQTVATQQARIKALEKEQSAWRKFTDEANRTLEAADKKIATLQARIEALEEKVKGKCKYYRESPNEQYTPTCTGTSWSVHPEDIEGDFCQFCGGKIKLKEYTPIPYHLQEMD